MKSFISLLLLSFTFSNLAYSEEESELGSDFVDTYEKPSSPVVPNLDPENTDVDPEQAPQSPAKTKAKENSDQNDHDFSGATIINGPKAGADLPED